MIEVFTCKVFFGQSEIVSAVEVCLLQPKKCDRNLAYFFENQMTSATRQQSTISFKDRDKVDQTNNLNSMNSELYVSTQSWILAKI